MFLRQGYVVEFSTFCQSRLNRAVIFLYYNNVYVFGKSLSSLHRALFFCKFEINELQVARANNCKIKRYLVIL